MIRAFLFHLACFSIFGLSKPMDLMTIPDCSKFDLSGMGLDSIRKPFLSGSSITCLNLANNQIIDIEQGAFERLPELNYLNLAGNPVSFEDFMKINLPKLKTLVLDGPFSQFAEHILESGYFPSSQRINDIQPIFLPTLQKLSLRNFTHEVFGFNDNNEGLWTWLGNLNVPNLTHLHLSGNHLNECDLPESIYRHLTHLNMDDNNMERIPNYPTLRHLSLDRNQIQNPFIYPHFMPHLEYLSLMDNKIKDLSRDAFKNMVNLRTLNLAMNQIEVVSSDVFYDMKNLKNLSLAKNRLSKIPEIFNLTSLRVLLLNGNKISAINDTSFSNLGNLGFLDLSHNQLTSIPSGTFRNLRLLGGLDLSWNKIAMLPENWMRPSPSVLNLLNLEGNLFTDVAQMSLGQFEYLGTLTVGHKPLIKITVQSLMTLPRYTNIDLSRIYDPKSD